jgi:hypothetical protein
MKGTKKARGKLIRKKRTKSKPLNAKKDFDTPLRRTPKQAQLLDTAPVQQQTLVKNGRMYVSYVKPHFERNKKGDRFVALEVSMHLTKQHDGLLPANIEQAWSFLGKKGYKRLDLIQVPAHFAQFYLSDDIDEIALEIPAARVTHVSLQVIEEKGTGKANKIIRLSFRLKVGLSRDVAHFSEWNFGDNYWLILKEVQGNLLEDQEEEDEEDEAQEEAVEEAAASAETPAPGA